MTFRAFNGFVGISRARETRRTGGAVVFLDVPCVRRERSVWTLHWVCCPSLTVMVRLALRLFSWVAHTCSTVVPCNAAVDFCVCVAVLRGGTSHTSITSRVQIHTIVTQRQHRVSPSASSLVDQAVDGIICLRHRGRSFRVDYTIVAILSRWTRRTERLSF